MFNGFYGIVVGIAVLIILWLLSYRMLGEGPFEFDAPDEPGTFEKQLAFYSDILKLILSLASASIVLLVGLRKSEQLPSSFASPLFLLAMSIFYGIICMVYLASEYEGYRHRSTTYTRFKYSKNLAFGNGSAIWGCRR